MAKQTYAQARKPAGKVQRPAMRALAGPGVSAGAARRCKNLREETAAPENDGAGAAGKADAARITASKLFFMSDQTDGAMRPAS